MKSRYHILRLTGYILILLAMACTGLHAQVRFQASVDKNQVGVGEYFQLNYELNSMGSDFRPPSVAGIEVVQQLGPSRQSYNINGQVSEKWTMKYLLQTKQEGEVVIPPASIKVKGEVYETETIRVKVTKAASSGSAVAESGDKDVFLKLESSKNSAYVGEVLTLSCYLYSKVNIGNFEPFDIQKDGFLHFTVPPVRKPGEPVSVNGVRYTRWRMQKDILVPQKAGQLEIPAISTTFYVQEAIPGRRSWADAIFGTPTRNVPRSVKTPPMRFNIKPLPEEGKPVGFTGAVGDLRMKVETDRNRLKANEAVTLTITLSGNGNLQLLETPHPDFSASFEVYDPKKSENISINENGISGSVKFEYVLIPRRDGKITIPSFPFHYFNPVRSSYVTLESPEFVIEVEPGSAPHTNAVRAPGQPEMIGDDIRYIHTGNGQLASIDNNFFASATHLALSGLPVLALFWLIGYARKRKREDADVQGSQSRKARKMARKRLAKAESLLKANQKEGYYEEVHKALWNYVGHRLRIEPADLSMEKALDSLKSGGVDDDTVASLGRLIGQCEMARYAPPGSIGELENFLEQSIQVIAKIENQLQ
ncbi:MAG: protein BatD [Flavobacteriales bacterium]|nr:protein BatD [Flavobacteriales bacterium]